MHLCDVMLYYIIVLQCFILCLLMKYCVLSMKYIHILSTTVWCYGFHITHTVTDIATPTLPNYLK